MKLMHTRLPDFYTKIEAAAKQNDPNMGFSVSGLENVKTAKLASLRVGRVDVYKRQFIYSGETYFLYTT